MIGGFFAIVQTSAFNVTASVSPPTLSSNLVSSALGIDSSSNGSTSLTDQRSITWNSTLDLEPMPGAVLVSVNAAGVVTQQNGLTATVNNGTITTGSITSDPTSVGDAVFSVPALPGDSSSSASLTGSPVINVYSGLTTVSISNASSLALDLGRIDLLPALVDDSGAVVITPSSHPNFTPTIADLVNSTNVTVQSVGLVSVGGDIDDPAGTITIGSGSTINEAAPSGQSLNASVINLTAPGAIGNVAAPLAIGNGLLNATSTGGSINVGGTGTLAVGAVTANSGTVSLSAGTINGVTGAPGVSATSTVLTAGSGGIGATTPVSVATPGGQGIVSATASGSISLAGGSAGLAPQTVTATLGNVTLSGQTITLGAASSVRAVSGAVSLKGGSNVTTAVGSALRAGTNVTISGSVSTGPQTPGSVIDLLGVIAAPVVTINGSNNPNTIILQNTQAGSSTTINTGSSGHSIVELGSKAAPPANNQGGTPGTDTGGTMSHFAGVVTVVGATGANNDLVLVDDSGDATARSITFSAGTLSNAGFGQGGALVVSNVGTTSLTTGTGNITLNVASVQQNTAFAATLNGPTDNVTIGNAGLLAGIAGQVQLTNNGSGALVINDSADTGATTEQLSPTGLSGLGTGGISYQNFTSVTLDLGSGADTLALTAVSVPTVVNTGLGADQVTVDPGQVTAALTVNSTAGGGATLDVTPAASSQLEIGKAGGTNPNVLSQLSGLGGSITFSGQSLLDITQSSAGDLLDIYATAEPITVNEAGSAAQVTLVSPSQAVDIALGGLNESATLVGNAAAPIEVTGGASDTLVVDLISLSTNLVGTLSNGVLSGLTGGAIDFSGLGTLNIEFGAGNDALTIDQTNASTTVFAEGGGGNDLFTLDQISSAVTLNGGTGNSVVDAVFTGVPGAGAFSNLDFFDMATLVVDDSANTTVPIDFTVTNGEVETALASAPANPSAIISTQGALATHIIGGSTADALNVLTSTSDSVVATIQGSDVTLTYGGNVASVAQFDTYNSGSGGMTFGGLTTGAKSFSNGGLTLATSGAQLVRNNVNAPSVSASGTNDVFTLTSSSGNPFSLYSITLAVPTGSAVPASLVVTETTIDGKTATVTLSQSSLTASAGGVFVTYLLTSVKVGSTAVATLPQLTKATFTPGVLQISSIVGEVAASVTATTIPSVSTFTIGGNLTFNTTTDTIISGSISESGTAPAPTFISGANGATLDLQGSLTIASGATITVTGSLPLTLLATDDVNIGHSVVFNANAVSATAVAGGGTGGPGGGGGSGGLGGSGGSGGYGGGKTYGTGNTGNTGNKGYRGFYGYNGFSSTKGTNGTNGFGASNSGGAGGAGGSAVAGAGYSPHTGSGGAGGAGGSAGGGRGFDRGGSSGGTGGTGGNGYEPPGATGLTGTAGSPGKGGTNTGSGLTGGGGGGGGSGGSGGSGGAGGAGGGGGGSGGSGGPGNNSGFNDGSGGYGGHGGQGGSGGQGGLGGYGGHGGAGGAGGGAFAIVAYGSLSIGGSGTLSAIGGAGGSFTSGEPGYAATGSYNFGYNTGKTNGGGGSYGGIVGVFGGSGGSGGNGGVGVRGETGGTGGTGGGGGGGAGGSVELVASVLNASAAVVNTQGGPGGGTGPTQGATGGNGKLIVGSNTGFTDPSAANSTIVSVAGPTSSSSYFGASATTTPDIDGLAGPDGAYGILSSTGLTSAINTAITNARNNAPADAVAAVIRLGPTPTGGSGGYGPAYSTGGKSFDMLLYVNLTSTTLSNPVLTASGSAIAAPVSAHALLLSNGTTITGLGANQVWATLVPSSNSTALIYVSASLSGIAPPAATSSLAEGSALYIASPLATPAPATTLPGFNAVAASPDGNQLYAVNTTTGSLVVINTANLTSAGGGQNQVLTNGSLTGTTTVSGLTGVTSVAVSPNGLDVYTAGNSPGSVDTFSRSTATGTLTYVTSVGLPGGGLSITSIAISADGKTLYATTNSSTYGVLQFARNTNTGTLSAAANTSLSNVGATSTGLAPGVSPNYAHTSGGDGDIMYVASPTLNGGTVTQISGSTKVTALGGLTGASSVVASSDNNFVYVASQTGNAIYVLQQNNVLTSPTAGSLTLVQTLQQGQNGVLGLAAPGSLTLSSDGRYLLVTDAGGSTVAVFTRNTTTGQLSFLQVLQQGAAGTAGLVNTSEIVASPTNPLAVYVAAAGSASLNGGIAELAIQAAAPTPATSNTSFTNIGTLAVGLGSGNNTVSLPSAPVATLGSLAITTGNGGNTVDLANLAPKTSLTTGSGPDTVTIGATTGGATLTVASGGGADNIAVNSAVANAAYNIIGGGSDTVTVNGGQLASGSKVVLTGGTSSTDGATFDFNPQNPTPSTINYTSSNGVKAPSGTVAVTNQGTITYTDYQTVNVIQAPIITVGSFTVTEGQSLSLNATITPLGNGTIGAVAWDLNDDGAFGDVTGQSVTVTEPQLVEYGISARGTYTIGVETTNSLGLTTEAFAKLIVQAAPPTVTSAVVSGTTATVGTPFAITFGATTTTAADQITGYQVNWGDGTIQTFGADVSGASHTYTEPLSAKANVAVSASDTYSNGAFSYAATNIAVTVALPSNVTAGGPYTVTPGQSVTFSTTLPGTPNSVSWLVNGHAVAGTNSNGGQTINVTWASLEAAGVTDATSYTVGVSYGYANGLSSTTPNTSLTVAEVAPTVVVTPGPAVILSNPGSFTLSLTDPLPAVQSGAATTSLGFTQAGTYTITNVALPSNGVVSVPAADLPASGTYTVYGEVTDKNGGVTPFTDTINVVNPPPTVTLTGNTSTAQGAVYTLGVAVTSPGPNTVQGGVVSWGDGTQQNFSGTTATLTHVFADNAPGMVSSLITVQAIDATTSYTATQSVAITDVTPVLTLSQPVAGTQGSPIQLIGTITDPGLTDSFTLAISWGDNTTSTINVPAGGITPATGFIVDHTYADIPTGVSYAISASVTDLAGVTGAPATTSEAIANVAPVVTSAAFSSPTIFEGGSATLVASFTDPGLLDTHTATVNWGDGTSSAATVNATNDTVTATHLYQSSSANQTNGVYTASVTVTDDHGASGSLTAPETVQNLAPVITGASLSAYPTQGGTVTLTGTFTDPGVLDTHTASVAWGDGTTSAATVNAATDTFTATHSFGAPVGGAGTPLTVVATVTDNLGASSTLVLDPPPTISNLAVSSPKINEGSSVTVTGAITDTAPTGQPNTVSIAWGDGNTTAATVSANGQTFTATHTYVDNPTNQPTGSYGIVATVKNSAGAATAAATSVQVNNVAPTVNALKLNVPKVNEGGLVSLSGTVVDPGLLDTETVTVAWGDGSTSTATINRTTRAFTATHVYLTTPSGQASATDTITVTATDNSGATGKATTSVVVNAVAPTVTALATSANTIAAGGTLSVAANVVDPGTQNTETVLVNWGDGTAPTQASVNPTTRAVSASHVYATASSTPYTITLTATSSDGLTGPGDSTNVAVSAAPAVQTLLAVAPGTASSSGTQSGTLSATAMAVVAPSQLIQLIPTDSVMMTGSTEPDAPDSQAMVFDDDTGSFVASGDSLFADAAATIFFNDDGDDWSVVDLASTAAVAPSGAAPLPG